MCPRPSSADPSPEMFWYRYRVRHPSEVTVECLGKGNMNENNENYEPKREIRSLIPLN